MRIAKETGIELTPLYTEPQPDRVAALTAEVERLRTQVATDHVLARAAVYARIDAENELREARAAVAAEREACADAESDAGRLALALDRLLFSTDMPAASRWWGPANEALDLHRSRLDATRPRGAKGCEKC